MSLCSTAWSKRDKYKHKDDEKDLYFALFLLCVDLRHQLYDSMQQCVLEASCYKGTLWAFCVLKRSSYYTQSISGLKWETVLIQPQIQQKGLKLSNTHSPISIQKHDSARSCCFRKRKKGICYSPEVSHCFQSAANMLPLLLPVLYNWNQTKRLHLPNI